MSKYAIDMDMPEFEAWATGYITLGIGEGKSLRSLVSLVCNQAAGNRVWGGCSGGGGTDYLDCLNGMRPRDAILLYLWMNRNVQCPMPVEDVVHNLLDRVYTMASDRGKSIRAAIRGLENEGLVVVTVGMIGLSNKGMKLWR